MLCLAISTIPYVARSLGGDIAILAHLLRIGATCYNDVIAISTIDLLAERLWEVGEKVWIGSLGLLFMVGMFTQRMTPRVALLTNEM